MAWYPAARNQSPIAAPHPGAFVHPALGVVLHTQQGHEAGTIATFKHGPAGTHFGIAYDGTVDQFCSTDDAPNAQAEGNRRWWSLEFEGFVTEPLTAQQIEAGARLIAWLWRLDGFVMQLTDHPYDPGIGWHGMGGAAWGGHPDCLPLDSTEVLTPDGWRWLGSITHMDRVASYLPDSGLITFNRPLAIIDPYEAATISVGGFEMTPNHRLYVFRTDHPTRKAIEARETNCRTNWLIPVAGEIAATVGCAIPPDLMRLLVWVQADGHYQQKNGRLDHLHFHFSKERKVQRVTEILDRLGKDYKLSRRKDGTTVIKVYGIQWLMVNVLRWLPDKQWDWWLLDASDDEFAALDEELTLADGSEHGGQRFYFSTPRRNVDVIQALYVTRGRPATIYETDGRYTLNLHTRRRGRALRDTYRDERDSTLVGCLTTINDTLLIRQNGRVAVVGNCPGPLRLSQRPLIYARVQALLSVTPPPAPTYDHGNGENVKSTLVHCAPTGYGLIGTWKAPFGNRAPVNPAATVNGNCDARVATAVSGYDVIVYVYGPNSAVDVNVWAA